MRLFWILWIALGVTVTAQDFTGQWEGHFSYNNIVDLEQSGGRVYAASDNAIFIYDTLSRTFTTLSTVNGLSGDQISQIFYRESANQLVIGYVNGLIQIVQDGVVLDVVAIRDKQVISSARKRINEFKLNDELLYIATDFGIAIYDLERLEFNDTYFIGDNGAQLLVKSIELFEGFLYAATSDAGIRRARLDDPFLIDFMNWEQINTGSYVEVIASSTQILAMDSNGTLLQLGINSFVSTGHQFPSGPSDATFSDNTFTVTGTRYTQVLDADLNVTSDIRDINGENLRFTAGDQANDILFVGTTTQGMARLDLNNVTNAELIVADGPTRNRAFALASSPNVLWVSYGDYDILYNPFPLEEFGVSRLSEGEWTNYTPEDVLNINSIASITINPEDPNEVYLNSMHNGILQFIDGAATELFGVSNSSLSSILPPSPEFVRIPDSSFDPDGNLWAIAGQVDDALNRKTPAGQWNAIDVGTEFTGVPTSSGVTKVVTNGTGNIFFGSTDAGVIAYNPRENRFGSLTEEIQQGNLVNNYVSELAVDQNGQLWIGSVLGLRVLSNANSVLSENPQDARAIIIEDQNGIPRELLADEAVLDIEVEGNNRKWIATGSSGAFLFSPTGRETIFQFTRDNSPLPSNSVNDIAIDESTGKVYFATDNGIVSFQGDRTSQPSENLEQVFAFPNPVKPGFDGNVTIDGLTDRARIKITDIEGNLVNELISQGGSVQWDTTSFNGSRVASGVYLLLISTDDNIETTVSKLMIIR